jgi:hypothetical protein
MIIVVARYHEDVEWTKQFPNVIIYNKGEELTDISNQIFLRNVGREGHTYYKHICDNYDNLTDYTIFLQGNPFDHSPNIISKLISLHWNRELDIGFEFLSERILNTYLTGCPHHPGLILSDTYERIFNQRQTNMEIQFGAGAQFIVSKKNILKRPKEFYSNIVNILQTSTDPMEGYVVERLHKIIFE